MVAAEARMVSEWAVCIVLDVFTVTNKNGLKPCKVKNLTLTDDICKNVLHVILFN